VNPPPIRAAGLRCPLHPRSPGDLLLGVPRSLIARYISPHPRSPLTHAYQDYQAGLALLPVAPGSSIQAAAAIDRLKRVSVNNVTDDAWEQHHTTTSLQVEPDAPPSTQIAAAGSPGALLRGLALLCRQAPLQLGHLLSSAGGISRGKRQLPLHPLPPAALEGDLLRSLLQPAPLLCCCCSRDLQQPLRLLPPGCAPIVYVTRGSREGGVHCTNDMLHAMPECTACPSP
jgi:hypothetical protein